MTVTMSPRASAHPPRDRGTRSTWVMPVVLQAVAMLGIGALLYPTASDWFATLGHNSQVSGYVEQLDQVPAATRAAALDAARAYNAQLTQGPLIDPFIGTTVDASYEDYAQLLRVGDSDVMGNVTYPRLGIGLPIYHGTSDEVLSHGAGHLYGSSLPVGGATTHAVLTSHSGLARASLFTPLPQARIGDVFIVEVLGEARYYQVDAITTVLPEDTDALRIEPGADHVTLITCTPIGINSHRLLVRGTRIDAPEDAGVTALAGDGLAAGFPWWAVGFVGASGAVALLLFVPARKRKRGDA